MSNNKAKGSGFEREVARGLSRLETGGEGDAVFWRTPGSGAHGGKYQNLSGDVHRIKGETNIIDEMVVECKIAKKLRVWSFFSKGKGLVRDYLEQVSREAEKVGKRPLLFVRRDRHPVFMMSLLEDGEKLGKHFGQKPSMTFTDGKDVSYAIWPDVRAMGKL